MFGLPMWLVQIVLSLIQSVGLPLVQKLLPKVPDGVWKALIDFITHVKSAPTPQIAEARLLAVHECIGAACQPEIVK